MKKRDIFWGVLLILAAIMIIVNRLGFFTQIGVFEIVATIVLIGIMIKSLVEVSFPGILFPAALLCIIYAEPLNITQLTPWPVLMTALLGSIGLSMIFKRHKYWNHNWNHEQYVHGGMNNHFSNVINQPDGNVVNCSVSFGSSMKYINATNFERANIKCSFGEMKIYFDNAIITSDRADIYVDVSFGSAQLYVPKTWKIVNEVNTSLGAMDVRNRGIDATSPVVTIRGNVSLGDVEVYYI